MMDIFCGSPVRLVVLRDEAQAVAMTFRVWAAT